MSDDRVDPEALAIGHVYRDHNGLAWAVLGRDERGAVRLAPPAEAPDWGGVLLEPDGGWYEDDRFLGYVEGFTPTRDRAACRGCGAPLVEEPGTDPANRPPRLPVADARRPRRRRRTGLAEWTVAAPAAA